MTAVIGSFCSGSQPPAGLPSGDVRLTAVWMPMRGSIDTTPQSLPNAMCPPAARMLPYAHPRDARSGPMFGIQLPSRSGVPWNGCCAAMTLSLPKRGMSAASTVSACSIRWRRPLAGAGFAAAARSKASSVIRTPPSPIACTHTCHPRLSSMVITRSNSSVFHSAGPFTGLFE